MKSIARFFPPVLALGFLALCGCEIDTVEGRRPQFSPSPTVVINEVFTLSETDPGLYSWVEFFNPTAESVDVTDWTLECRTNRLRYNVLVIVDSGVIREREPVIVAFDQGTYRIPITRFVDDPRLTVEVGIKPRGFLTIVDNDIRLRNNTNYGPADDPRYIRNTFPGTIDQIDTLLHYPDSLTVLLGGWYSYQFTLKTTDQLVLRNAAGEVVDVVRYGGYTWSGPGSDPYSGNVSLGSVPPYESICRYAGGFKTNPMSGNTANDFYITDAFARPIPHWFSQKQKL